MIRWMSAFDMPDTHESCGRRTQTITAPQALTLLNDDQSLQWAQALAGRVIARAAADPAAQVNEAFRLAYTRAPNAWEKDRILTFFNRWKGNSYRSVFPKANPLRTDYTTGGPAPRKTLSDADVQAATTTAHPGVDDHPRIVRPRIARRRIGHESITGRVDRADGTAAPCRSPSSGAAA